MGNSHSTTASSSTASPASSSSTTSPVSGSSTVIPPVSITKLTARGDLRYRMRIFIDAMFKYFIDTATKVNRLTTPHLGRVSATTAAISAHVTSITTAPYVNIPSIVAAIPDPHLVIGIFKALSAIAMTHKMSVVRTSYTGLVESIRTCSSEHKIVNYIEELKAKELAGYTAIEQLFNLVKHINNSQNRPLLELMIAMPSILDISINLGHQMPASHKKVPAWQRQQYKLFQILFTIFRLKDAANELAAIQTTGDMDECLSLLSLKSFVQNNIISNLHIAVPGSEPNMISKEIANRLEPALVARNLLAKRTAIVKSEDKTELYSLQQLKDLLIHAPTATYNVLPGGNDKQLLAGINKRIAKVGIILTLRDVLKHIKTTCDRTQYQQLVKLQKNVVALGFSDSHVWHEIETSKNLLDQALVLQESLQLVAPTHNVAELKALQDLKVTIAAAKKEVAMLLPGGNSKRLLADIDGRITSLKKALKLQIDYGTLVTISAHGKKEQATLVGLVDEAIKAGPETTTLLPGGNANQYLDNLHARLTPLQAALALQDKLTTISLSHDKYELRALTKLRNEIASLADVTAKSFPGGSTILFINTLDTRLNPLQEALALQARLAAIVTTKTQTEHDALTILKDDLLSLKPTIAKLLPGGNANSMLTDIDARLKKLTSTLVHRNRAKLAPTNSEHIKFSDLLRQLKHAKHSVVRKLLIASLAENLMGRLDTIAASRDRNEYYLLSFLKADLLDPKVPAKVLALLPGGNAKSLLADVNARLEPLTAALTLQAKLEVLLPTHDQVELNALEMLAKEVNTAKAGIIALLPGDNADNLLTTINGRIDPLKIAVQLQTELTTIARNHNATEFANLYNLRAKISSQPLAITKLLSRGNAARLIYSLDHRLATNIENRLAKITANHDFDEFATINDIAVDFMRAPDSVKDILARHGYIMSNLIAQFKDLQTPLQVALDLQAELPVIKATNNYAELRGLLKLHEKVTAHTPPEVIDLLPGGDPNQFLDQINARLQPLYIALTLQSRVMKAVRGRAKFVDLINLKNEITKAPAAVLALMPGGDNSKLLGRLNTALTRFGEIYENATKVTPSSPTTPIRNIKPIIPIHGSKPSSILLGWNCFDVAVGYTKGKLDRDAIVNYALTNYSSLMFRSLLAPEIKAAALLVTSFSPAIAMSPATYGTLPLIMHSGAVPLVEAYYQAIEDMAAAVSSCNAALGNPVGAYLSLDQLDDFFANPSNRFVHKKIYDGFIDDRNAIYTQHEAALNKYCLQESTYRQYVAEYYGKYHWFAFQRGVTGEYGHTSMVDIVANKLTANIAIYQGDEIIYQTKLPNAARIINVDYDGSCHFVARTSPMCSPKAITFSAKHSTASIIQTVSANNIADDCNEKHHKIANSAV